MIAHVANQQLSGRRAVVTGASTGIGRAVATAFAAEGARVVINYANNVSAAEALQRELEAGGAETTCIRADVSQADDIDRLVREAAAWLGGIDLWANIAGADILTGAAAGASDREKLARLLEVDLRGTILCSWAAIDAMGDDGGVILNMSWDLALVGMARRNPEMFAATKAGITGFTRSLARSVAPAVRVNEIAPGWIATAFAEQDMDKDYRQWVIGETPLGRFGQPEDIAAAAVFLCSERASFITGQTLKVNGGLSS